VDSFTLVKSTLFFTRDPPLPANAAWEDMIPESRKAMPTPEPSTSSDRIRSTCGRTSATRSAPGSAGLTIPASFELPHDLQFAVVPTVEAAVDEDGSGRHLAYSVVTALTVPVGGSGLSGTVELWGQRDNDSSGHTSQFSLDAVAAWQPKQLANVQLDIGTYLGLNRNTPDVEMLGGVAIRF